MRNGFVSKGEQVRRAAWARQTRGEGKVNVENPRNRMDGLKAHFGSAGRGFAAVFFLVAAAVSPCLGAAGAGVETGEMLSLFSPARPAALSAFAAVGCGISGMSFNPAALASQKAPAVSGTYLDWIEDSRVGEIRVALPCRESCPVSALGASFGAFEAGDIEVEEESGVVDKKSAQDDYLVSLGFGSTLPMGVSLGGAVKWYRSTLLSEFTDSTVLADAGMMWHSSGGDLALGVALKNIGRGLKYLDTRVPFHSVLTTGVAWKVFSLESFLAVADISFSRDGQRFVSGGVEWELFRMLALRCGTLSSEYMQTLSGGVGLRYGKLQFDYAIVIPKGLVNTSRASLTLWM